MAIKTAELHVHLEGTITPTLARQLAKRNQLIIPDGLISPDNSSYLSRDFHDFLKVFDTVADLIKTPQDYFDLTLDYLRNCAREHAIYVEMMYSPDHAEKVSGIPSLEHLHAIQQAVDDAEDQFTIVGRILITAVRHFGQEAAIRVAKKAVLESVPCIVGFALGGDEINFPPHLFNPAYEIAAEAGLACTAHAGEFSDPSDVTNAIEHLNIKRVGHGISAINCSETLNILKDQGIALELCPSSNIKLGIFPDMTHHPLPKLLDAGIQISINSDDPPFMNTTLGEEYKRVQKAYQYDDETMTRITRMAIQAAFVDEITKKQLLRQI